MSLRMEDLRPYFDQFGRRLESIEAQLVLLSEKAGLTYTPVSTSVPEDVIELARAGKTIEAMKRYRELTNVDFEEARRIVAGL
jgi:ribosomal protein L7/L12